MIITLCGSARFEAWFHMWNEAISLADHCVFGLASYPSQHDGLKDWYTSEEKANLDVVHGEKIRASHGVVFLNVMAYMGESTLRELALAKRIDKKLFFLESWGLGCGIGGGHTQEVQDDFARFGLKGGSPVDTTSRVGGSPFDLLGNAGAYRTAIVKRLREREANALGFDSNK
jgi:hypothetical protein